MTAQPSTERSESKQTTGDEYEYLYFKTRKEQNKAWTKEYYCTHHVAVNLKVLVHNYYSMLERVDKKNGCIKLICFYL